MKIWDSVYISISLSDPSILFSPTTLLIQLTFFQSLPSLLSCSYFFCLYLFHPYPRLSFPCLSLLSHLIFVLPLSFPHLFYHLIFVSLSHTHTHTHKVLRDWALVVVNVVGSYATGPFSQTIQGGPIQLNLVVSYGLFRYFLHASLFIGAFSQ